jgi:hypothetical protein
MAPLPPLILKPQLFNRVTPKFPLRKSKQIIDPLSLCFSERLLILDAPKTRSKKPFWMELKTGDVLLISIMLKENNSFSGKTYQTRCVVHNESSSDIYSDYPVNILRYLKRLKYQQL